MDLVDRLQATRYLGKEFLTWLWFRSDRDEGLVKLSDSGPTVQVWFTDSVVLSGTGEEAERVAIRTSDPSGNKEARTALRMGKQVEQARLTIINAQREWSLALAGEEFNVGSVKLPALLTKEEDDQFSERMHLIDQLDEMVSGLFTHFISLRMDTANWPSERDAITEWIRSDPR